MNLCGFADSAHFTHAFKRIFSITPSDYTKG
ncbi:MAG: AraC family transcriptional regulator [Prevotella sp.]|nr:AraC family transcriptional regulator [Prevotella sp.]